MDLVMGAITDERGRVVRWWRILTSGTTPLGRVAKHD